jgi:hypothetical protein
VIERVVLARETIFSTAQESFDRTFPQLLAGSLDKMIELLRVTKVISAPLVSEDRVIGMLSVQSEDLGG